MATIANQFPTLVDQASRLDPNKRDIAKVVELLSENNPMLMDASAVEGNLPYGHQTTVRTGLPKGTWRRLYQGVPPTKARTAQVIDECGRLETYAEIDAAMPGNIAALRADEDMAHIEGLSQQLADTLWYGDKRANPAQFNGLAMRYNSLSAVNAQNIINAGGTGTDNRSIWLIGWHPSKITLIYPPARTGPNLPPVSVGVMREDLGRVTSEVIDQSGGRMEIYRTHFVAELGLCVRDWRWAVRICNISLAALTRDAASGPMLEDLLVRGIHRLGGNTRMVGNFGIYADREMVTWLHRQVLDKKTAYIGFDKIGGTNSTEQMLNLSIGGAVIQPTDSLNVDEARVQ